MNVESQKKARLWLALVFALGAALGAVFGYAFSQRHALTLAAPPPNAPLSEPERRAKRITEMTKELNLTADQSSSFDSILHQAHDQMKVIHDKSDADIDSVRMKARDQMRQLLTPDQKPKFEEMVQHMDAERKKQQQQLPPK
jgi:Spy/CpxP family protein refolding chaperone